MSSAVGPSAAARSAPESTRLTIVQNPSVWAMINGTPLNTVPIFGNQQSTT